MRFARKSIADWLDEAADYLEKNGWWKGALRGPNRKQACAIGAILFSQGMNESEAITGEVNAVCRSLLKAVPISVTCVEDWNDHHAESKQEVVDTFRKAAKIERAGFDPDEGIVS